LAKTIRYTRVFQYLFAHHPRERRTDPAQPIIKNLAFAQQRFDSLAKPLARLVQHFDSALDVVTDILRERGRASPEHINAARLVDILDSEAMLQMGMLADCAELCLELTRFFDKETFDIGLVPQRLHDFKDVCQFMFARGGCMTYPGHTTTMLQLIKNPRLLHTSTGQPRTIGDVSGVSDEVAATCLARMQNWWTLARAVLSAEFPDFDVVRCFSAFDLPRVEGGGLAHLRLVPRDALVRVANFLALNPEGLVAEFRDLRVVAERVRQTTTCSNASDWAAEIHDTQTSPKRRACYKVRHLLPALRRYMVYSGSSSGVEQCFSKCKFLMGERRNFRERAKQRVLVLSTSARHATKDAELCSSARLLWAANFGRPRAKRQAALPERLQVQALRQKRKAEDPHTARLHNSFVGGPL
jgi:hypothetical protein